METYLAETSGVIFNKKYFNWQVQTFCSKSGR